MKRALLLLLVSRAAFAFPTGAQFDMDPMKADGAGGIAFDGAPRWTGHTCVVCHTNAPGLIGIRLEANQSDVFTTGWTSGTQYHMRVVMTNEHEGLAYQPLGDNCGFSVTPYVPCDVNGFALEMDTDGGMPVGKFVPVVANACLTTGTVPPDVDSRVLTDGSAVTHNGAHSGVTAWDFCWTAPAAGTGTITAYIASVDGNGGDGTINFPNDTIGDDVASGAVPIAEAGAAPPPGQTGGCNAAGDGGIALVIAIGALGAVLRRRKRVIIALALAACASGCAHVRPRQRETLAKRNMKFSPDPAEDELDLHMQEAREGSTGGYGSSGGGCGCN